MKLSHLFLLLAPLLLTACGLSDQQKADYQSVQRSGVSSAVYDKMMHGDHLSLYDIKALTRARVSDAVILRYLRDHGSVYYLNSSDVAGLRKAGVSPSIIDYMLATPRRYGPWSNPYWDDPYWGGPYWGPYWDGGFFYGGGGYHRHWH